MPKLKGELDWKVFRNIMEIIIKDMGVELPKCSTSSNREIGREDSVVLFLSQFPLSVNQSIPNSSNSVSKV